MNEEPSRRVFPELSGAGTGNPGTIVGVSGRRASRTGGEPASNAGLSSASNRSSAYVSQLTAEELLALCADNGNTAAWEEFLRRFHSLVISTVRRIARRYTAGYADLCNDLAQEVYLKFSRDGGNMLRRFRPMHAGAAFGFVRVVAANLTHDYFKKKGAVRNETELPVELAAGDELEWRLLNRDVDDFLRRHARGIERQIFWLYYRHGMSAREIATLPGVGLTVKGVESVILRLGARIRAELAGKEKNRRADARGDTRV